MSKSNILLADESLKSFIRSLGLSQEDKNDLVRRVPQLNREERTELFKTLTKILLLDEEEKKVDENIERLWEK